MFDDARSKKIVLVAHCVLNQNAKLDRCAHYPGAIREVAQLLVQSGVGIVQLPCPELLLLGLARSTDPAANPSVEEEDTRIHARMTAEASRKAILPLVETVIAQIEQYDAHQFEVIGLIGINGSSTCGVETTWADGCELCKPGVFIELLQGALRERSLSLPMAGIRAYRIDEAMRTVARLLGGSLQNL